ncbi:MAG: PDZ domain-containing protein [Planctomycetes bacterium]|nr:PDZ domain-containing protein [Planctomycetota bacterium]
MQRHDQIQHSRWLRYFGVSLVACGLIIGGFQVSPRDVAARADDKKVEPAEKKTAEEIEDEVRRALEALKNGPDKKEEKKADLNPIDEMRQAEDALKKAREALKADPKSDEARKAVEDATKRFQESMKNRQPNLEAFPIAPLDPENFEKDFERLNQDLLKAIEQLHRQMQGGQFQPGVFPGIVGGGGLMRGNIGGNRLGLNGGMRLGVRLQRPPAALAEQLDLPADKGLVVTYVAPNSVADKAGIKSHDVLLEIGGKAVPSDALELQRFMKEFKADEKVAIVLMRKGKKETIAEVILPEAKNEVNQFRGIPRFQFPNIPNLNPAFPPQAFEGGNNNTTSMSVSVVNGDYNIKFVENDLKISLVGSKEDDQIKLSSIEVDDNGKMVKAESLEKLEEPYRAKVEGILKRVK